MINLAHAIERIRDNINEIQLKIKKLEADKQQLQNALEVNLKINEACLKCHGRGWHNCLDDAGQNDTCKCHECGGTGKK